LEPPQNTDTYDIFIEEIDDPEGKEIDEPQIYYDR